MPMNYVKTAMLLAFLTAIFVAMGALIGGEAGMLIAFLVALAMNLFSFWKSDTMVLRMHGAEEVDERSAPEYFGLVRELAQRAELPMPRVYVMHNPQPNAFATGRNPANSAVCASTGLLEMLSREEVAGVMAHELAHIKNRDTLTMTVSATIAGAISTVAQFGFLFGGRGDDRPHPIMGLAMMILAPLAAMIIQMAISRSREYEADASGAQLTGDPLALASALRKLEAGTRALPLPPEPRLQTTSSMMIANPFRHEGVANWFSTHPPMAERIARLEQLAGYRR